MNRNLTYISFLTLILFAGACDTFEGDDEGFLQEAGPILFVSDESGTSQLYSLQPDGSDVRQLTSDPDEPVIDAKWSPNGQSIVLTSYVYAYGAGGYFEYLYTTDANGKNRRRLSRNRSVARYESDGDPVWSPDGKQLAFGKTTGCCEGGTLKAYRVKYDGSRMQMFGGHINTHRSIITDWSADGMSLVGHSNVAAIHGSELQWYHYITQWTTSGDSLSAFGEAGKDYSWPIVSSTGQMVAFQISQGSDRGLYTATKTGDNIQRIDDGSYPSIKPVAWSADDSRILADSGYGSGRSFPVARILIVDADGSTTTDISPFSESQCRPTSWR